MAEQNKKKFYWTRLAVKVKILYATGISHQLWRRKTIAFNGNHFDSCLYSIQNTSNYSNWNTLNPKSATYSQWDTCGTYLAERTILRQCKTFAIKSGRACWPKHSCALTRSILAHNRQVAAIVIGLALASMSVIERRNRYSAIFIKFNNLYVNCYCCWIMFTKKKLYKIMLTAAGGWWTHTDVGAFKFLKYFSVHLYNRN